MTFTSEQLRSTYCPNAKATLRLMSFSYDIFPFAPESFPPCPASMTNVNFLSAAMLMTAAASMMSVKNSLFRISLINSTAKLNNFA